MVMIIVVILVRIEIEQYKILIKQSMHIKKAYIFFMHAFEKEFLNKCGE
jgi:hypothetical protein